MFSNIPAEMRAYAQWIVWRFEDRGGDKPTKVPYIPNGNGERAKVIDPSTWRTFDEAVAAAPAHDGIGFVLTDNDPYTIVDLDDAGGDAQLFNLQREICSRLNSYTELSPSRKGVHVIVRGKIPAGRKRNKIEIYSSARYMTMTGNHLNNTPTVIADQHAAVNELFERLCGGRENVRFYDGREPQRIDDAEVINRASVAANGDKFIRLNEGNWHNDYPSQSEADLSYVNMLAFYTQNREQIARIFRNSPLGARNKQTSIRGVPYIDHMINKSFDRMLPPIDTSALVERLKQAMIDEQERKTSAIVSTTVPMPDVPVAQPVPHVAPSLSDTIEASPQCELPDGLLGEIAQFIYAQAPRPVPEIALAGAMAFMAGICGRAFNISNTGLNQYIMLLAPSGRGKEAMATGINKLIASVSDKLPTANDFIGPSTIMSPQALTKYMNTGPKSFVTIIGEAGIFLQNLTHPKAPANMVALKGMLLDLYNKSGNSNVLRPMIYADAAKNTLSVKAPALTLLGESTQSEFYAGLDDRMIASGLLPRFTIVEYNGPRVPKNENAAYAQPSDQLLRKLHDLIAQATMLNTKDTVVNVACDNDALEILNQFDRECDMRINSTDNDGFSQLWNRAHLNVLKTAALVAVGCNPYSPIVKAAHAVWAIKMVKNHIQIIQTRFDSGEVGNSSNEVKQLKDLKEAIRKYVLSPFSALEGYKVSATMHNEKIIPYAYLQRVLVNRSAFKNDRQKPSDVIKNTLRTLCERGDIAQMPQAQMIEKYNSRGNAFVIVTPSEFGF